MLNKIVGFIEIDSRCRCGCLGASQLGTISILVPDSQQTCDLSTKRIEGDELQFGEELEEPELVAWEQNFS